MSVVGARPNLMKIAPFIHELRRHPERFEHYLVHTGQHYDAAMSKSFFEKLDIPEPDINLDIGSGTHAEQVGRTMIEFEKAVRSWKPNWIVVVGDVNATCACSIVAKKEHAKLAHIEAGLRSFDLDMPEEINRMVTDRLSDLLFTPDEISSQNLRNEGVPEDRIKFVGNIMIDTLEKHRAAAEALRVARIIEENWIFSAETTGPEDQPDQSGSTIDGRVGRPRPTALSGRGSFPADRSDSAKPQSTVHSSLSTPPSPFSLLTLHRPSNVDSREVLEPLVRFFIDEVATDMPIIWPLHPRTRKQLELLSLWAEVESCPGIVLLTPVGYHEMLKLNMSAKVLFTDSGGLQEESCVLGTPCITLRYSTERPVTLTENGGLSTLTGNSIDNIRTAYQHAKAHPSQASRPPLWDGKAAERIVEHLGQMRGASQDGT